MSATASLRRRLAPIARLVRSADERRDQWWELRRRLSGVPSLPETEVRNVLVVCFGNICRSPFAERLLARARPQLVVRSAGFEARNGDPAEPNAIVVAAEFGVDLSDHAAHRIAEVDVAWADLIVGMTGRHHAMLRDRWPAHASKTRLLGDFLEAPPHRLIDPWGCPPEAFRAVYARIVDATGRLSSCLPSPGPPEGTT
jgi:protein-tyrosine phosphatase